MLTQKIFSRAKMKTNFVSRGKIKNSTSSFSQNLCQTKLEENNLFALLLPLSTQVSPPSGVRKQKIQITEKKVLGRNFSFQEKSTVNSLV